MDPFFSRLRDYWERVGTVLRGEAEVSGIFPNSTDVGGQRERLYLHFLRHHVPAFCTVKLGGFAFGADGSESRQIDVLVASGSSMQFDFQNRDGYGKSFSCVDGLVAAISLKSYIDGSELADAVDNLASLPTVQPLGQRYHPLGPPITDYESWPLKVVYAPDGVTVKTALDRLADATSRVPSARWPHFVHVCGKYVLVRVGPEGGTTRDGTVVAANSFFPITLRPDALGFGMVVQRIQNIEQTMRMLLFDYRYIIDRLPV